MRIVTDLDGVIADWCTNICGHVGVNPSDVVEWTSINDITGLSMPEIYAICEANGSFGMLEPYDGAIEAVRQLLRAGHDVQFVTARPAFSEAETCAWLQGYFGEEVPDLDERIHILSNGESKYDAVPDAELYIDDSPGVLSDIWQKTMVSDFPQFVCRFERIWNQKSDEWDLSFTSWGDILDFVETYTEWFGK